MPIMSASHIGRPSGHDQVWVKVNAPVDAGIAEVVSILNRFEGLYTLDSCEGIAGEKPAHVYFNYGDWRQIGDLMFDHIGPALFSKFGNEAIVSLEVFNGSEPMGKLSFDKEATCDVASLLERLVHERP
jgi:hypothetical protein